MSTSSARPRNRRGEGTKLRDEIVEAAAKLLEDTGSADAVTLRAIAREIGVAAPSIYAHFVNREAIVDAVIDQAYEEFRAALVASGVGESDPVVRLSNAGRAYLKFAAAYPRRYGILFAANVRVESDRTDFGNRQAAFAFLSDLVQACVDAGRSTSTDPVRDSVAIWAAVHGLAVLRADIAVFDWPPAEDTLDRILLGLARITE